MTGQRTDVVILAAAIAGAVVAAAVAGYLIGRP